MFTAIVAYDSNYGIGKNNKIPWKLPEDIEHFKNTTINNIVIMGRKTYESIGKPLSNRINFIISSTLELKIDDTNLNLIKVFKTPLECVKECLINDRYKNIKLFIIGGTSIYNWFYEKKLIGDEFLTEIEGDYNCDTYFKYNHFYTNKNTKILNTWNYKYHNSDNPSAMLLYNIYINNEENNILELMSKILKEGISSNDRTGTGTLSLFGERLTFDLSNNNFPLMTTRKLFFRGIFEELMFYLRGQTNNKFLIDKGVNIWTANTTREFLDKRGLNHLPVGDFGHSYGFSFRHFGANYINCNTDYKDQGYDQIKNIINEIKLNPESRRLVISLWEPNNMSKAALPPCLIMYQFYIRNNKISCMMTQRSSDYFTAGGWNIATGSLLTILLSKICNLEPDKLIWNIGDVHIYQNLINQAKEQLLRNPYTFPKLYFKEKEYKNIEDFNYEDLELLGYKYHPNIKFDMNV